MKIGTAPVAVYTLLIIIFLFPETNLLAQANFSYDQSEIVLETEIQYDWIDEDCDPIDCEEKDGLRVADFLFRYNYFTSTNSLLFAEINTDWADNVGTNTLLNVFSTHEQYPETNSINSALVGSQIENVEISIGNQFPVSRGFSPTRNSYLGLDLSAFSDDRYLISNGSTDNIVLRADWSDRYRIAASSGATENDNLTPDLNYELFFDAPLFGSEGFFLSGALKSIEIKELDDFTSAGIKLSWFQNNGNLFELAYSKNDLGNYTEFLFQRDWGSRYRLELGVTKFNEDSDGDIQEIDVISDSHFAYVNFTISISRTLRWFVEGSEFNSDSFENETILSGIVFSF